MRHATSPLLTQVRQYGHRWGFDDYFTTGKRIQVRRVTKGAAQSAHTDLFVLLSNGRKDLAGIDGVELAQFRKWKQSKTATGIAIGEAIDIFVKSKQNRSSRHYDGLRRDLDLLRDSIGKKRDVSEIETPELQSFINNRRVGDRRRFNLRSELVSFFRWLREKSYLREGKTAAEKLDAIEKQAGHVQILTVDQMRALLANVREEFLPWLVIGAFAGIRSEEIAPDPKSKKSRLAWEDFKWKRRLIDVRRETAKTGKKRKPQRRLIPIEDNLLEWLRPWHSARGAVCERQPTKHETCRLGKFIGGKWPHNCLRDSYGSYWMAIHKNMPALAYQMGNSVQMIEQSYHERQDELDAREWFSVFPSQSSHRKVTSFVAQADLFRPLYHSA
jgi:integrase